MREAQNNASLSIQETTEERNALEVMVCSALQRI